MDNLRPVPKTLGVIMDGNFRWAKKNDLPCEEGHLNGMYNMVEVLKNAFAAGVENVVCYAFSTENLSRSETEVKNIFKIILDTAPTFIAEMTKAQASVRFIGDMDRLPEVVRKSFASTQAALEGFSSSGKTAYIAVAYGGRAEIIAAVNRFVKEGKQVDESTFLNALNLPFDVDMIIRTGGEKRISNFLLYQSHYAELYFCDKCFPDFSKEDLIAAFDWFASRKRNLGLRNS